MGRARTGKDLRRASASSAPEAGSPAAGSAQAAATPELPAPGPSFGRRIRAAAGHAPAVLLGLAVIPVGSTALAALWFAVCRLAYVVLVGAGLRSEAKARALSHRVGPEAAWQAFRERASRLMIADVVAFGALCVVTRGTLPVPGPAWVGPVVAGVLVLVGVGIKSWATASLPEGTFYWRDFFVRPAETRSVSGPYRWISNPMYTVGYAHAYGFAVLLASAAGLVAAFLAQLAILALAAFVERPHLRGLER